MKQSVSRMILLARFSSFLCLIIRTFCDDWFPGFQAIKGQNKGQKTGGKNVK